MSIPSLLSLCLVLFVALSSGGFVPEVEIRAANSTRRSFQPETPSIQLFTTNINLHGNRHLYLANYAGYDSIEEWSYDCERQELKFVCGGQECFFRLWYVVDGSIEEITQPTLSAEFATEQLEVGSFSSSPSDVFTRYLHDHAITNDPVSHQFVSGLRVFSSCVSSGAFCAHDGVADDSFPTNSIYFSGQSTTLSPPNANADGCGPFFDSSAADPLVLTWADGQTISVESCGLAYTLDPLDATPADWCPPPVVTGPNTKSVRFVDTGYVDTAVPPLPAQYFRNEGSDSYTFEFWFFGAGPLPENLQLRVIQSHVFHVYYENSLHFVFRGESSTEYDMELLNFQEDQWHHFAAVRDGTNNKYQLYHNTQLIFDGVANADVALGATSCPANNCVSSDVSGIYLMGWIPGYLDELRVWKSARTQAEISASYQTSILSADATLLFSMTFEEDPPIDHVTMSSYPLYGDAEIYSAAPFS